MAFVEAYPEAEYPGLHALLLSRALLAEGLPFAAYGAAARGREAEPEQMALVARLQLTLQEMHPGYEARERLRATRLWVGLAEVLDER